MLGGIAKAIFGSSNDRYVKSMRSIVQRINGFEPQMETMDDATLQAQTQRFRERLAAGETLDSLLPEAFATIREASRRVLGMRHFDVQMIGGIVLHRGEIPEMRTGEGKTLVATLATYLNALESKGVHVVTVNDYLARRDAEWMGQIYRWMGLTVGVIVPNLSDPQRKDAYDADITYGTNNEFGFDYLRDNMKYDRSQMVQRPFNYAIVDEVDSILIDEARTPLIISGPTEDKSELYRQIDVIVKTLEPASYEQDEKQRTVILTEEGTEEVERKLEAAGLMEGGNLYDFVNTQVVHHVNQALKANVVFKRDIDYIVKDDKVVIIDEFTGRMMDGRRWSDGLHQAVEAKEGVEVQPENQTLASITFQNYFRMYPKLSGMTGTAATEATEFYDIYKMNVVEIPTNVPVARRDEDDEFYKNMKDKFAAIANGIAEARDRGQPVLVGTVSIEKSEMLSDFLKERGVPHTVLNARYHEQESHLVAQAGRLGAVTIATNMAGRGTDIQLGGNAEFRFNAELGDMPAGPERDVAEQRIRDEVLAEREAVRAAGGLFVLGTERHESRRIDNQLRGRAGRQGDPGVSRFYLCLEDDLLRIFGQQTLFARMMNSQLPDGEAVVSPWITKAIETAQKKVEARNYDIRKQVVEYDNVMNDQRKVVYEQRADIMDSETVGDVVIDMRQETVNALVGEAVPLNSYPEQWNVAGLTERARDILGVDLPIADWVAEGNIDPEMLEDRVREAANMHMAAKIEAIPPEIWVQIEKSVLLQSLDHHWKEHLATLDALRQVIHLRAYAQKTPLNEYKQEGFALFEKMLGDIREDVTRLLAQAQFQMPPAMPEMPEFVTTHIDPLTGRDDTNDIDAASHGFVTSRVVPQVAQPTPLPPMNEASAEDVEEWKATVGRNAPCPCGSGRKFKHCHGAW